MHDILQQLLQSRTVLSDGAWGTQLQQLGLLPGEHPDYWNLEHPDRVEQVARRYVEAGSKVILTNTFRSNRIALGLETPAETIRSLNAEGVRISKRAAGDRARVFASIGPCGKMLMMGDVEEADVRAAFAEQAEALASAGADGLIVETMTDVQEALVALQAAKPTGLPVGISMVFDSGAEHDRTMMGVAPEEAALTLQEAGADFLGANCGLGVEAYLPICRRLKGATTLPVWIKPNAGLPEMVEGTIRYRITPKEFAAKALALRDAGASFLGGCCGTDPAFVAALAEALGS